MDESQRQRRMLIEDEHEGHKFTWDLNLRPSSSPAPPKVTCDQCGGNCIGNHFRGLGLYDDPVNCWKCNNSGMMSDPAFVWKPTPPEDLVARLRKVYKDYWNEVQNENFKLE